jgi:predicted HTH transcriptional regulator
MRAWELKELIGRGEGQHVEFKRKANHPEKIMKEIVAFANASGGYLFIGVDDSGTIPGLRFPTEDAYVLEKAIEKYCKPKISYKLDLVHLSGQKSVLCFYIEESSKKPHYVIEDFETNWGRAYVRVKDRSIQASREVRQILKRSRRNKDIHFQYGEKERQLLGYLEEHEHITVNEFAQLAHLNRYKSSQTLVLLVLANVLEIIPQEKEDIFILKELVSNEY